MRLLTFAVAVGFGIARLTMPVVSEIHREDLFKDFSHLFVAAYLAPGSSAAAIACGLQSR